MVSKRGRNQIAIQFVLVAYPLNSTRPRLSTGSLSVEVRRVPRLGNDTTSPDAVLAVELGRKAG